MPNEIPDDDLLDGCDPEHDLSDDALPEGHDDLFVLFAEALDPETAKTVPEAEAEWQELLG